MEFDAIKQSVKYDGKEYYVTPLQMRILRLLYKNKNEIVSRRQLLVELDREYRTPRLIDVNIFRIRKEFGYDIIESIHKVGYRLIIEED